PLAPTCTPPSTLPPPTCPTLFPYTTLFRSRDHGAVSGFLGRLADLAVERLGPGLAPEGEPEGKFPAAADGGAEVGPDETEDPVERDRLRQRRLPGGTVFRRKAAEGLGQEPALRLKAEDGHGLRQD